MKFCTFGRTFNFQILPYVAPCYRAEECSTQSPDFSLRAMRWADLTENCCVLFAVHIRLSCESRWLSRSAKISTHVLWVKVATSLPLSHCLVSWLIKLLTRIWSSGSLRKTDLFCSHLCDRTPMFWPSPTLHVDPSLMTSLAAKSDL